jgi:hypothetical protein
MSNPWFLDCQRTLLELADSMLAFSLGSHVGYAIALNRPVLFAPLEIQQDVSAASELWRKRYSSEWKVRAELMERLGVEPHLDHLQRLDAARARDILNPFFGFDSGMEAAPLRRCLLGEA